MSIPNLLCGFAVWLYWGMIAKIIQQVHFGSMPVFWIWEFGGIACLIGVAGIALMRSFAASNSVPRSDPYLGESLSYHTDG